VEIAGKRFEKDAWTNVTPKILSHVGRNLYLQSNHPLSLVRERIINYFYKTFTRSSGKFTVVDNINPVVTVEQNFDSLLIPESHPSRAKSDCYYINSNYLLRAHTTAHQKELMQNALNNFLITGDVYRRDEIDKTHYPVFHQIDGVKLYNKKDLFGNKDLELFEPGYSTEMGKQTCHTLEAVKILEHQLKLCLGGLAKEIFGTNVEYRWVDTHFPFTCPSWELEVKYENDWLELLGCGVMRQPIISEAGISDRVGWAFGLGLERIAMKLYDIPDIRQFWSTDSGFLNQFKNANFDDNIKFKPVSKYPQCTHDISFWLPDQSDEYSSNDFYDLVRNIGGDVIEQVSLIDNFSHPKKNKVSHCYRIVYRHMDKTLTTDEVNQIHKQIEKAAVASLRVIIR